MEASPSLERTISFRIECEKVRLGDLEEGYAFREDNETSNFLNQRAGERVAQNRLVLRVKRLSYDSARFRDRPLIKVNTVADK